MLERTERAQVKMPASPSKPASYISATVRSICGPYFLVSLEGRGRQEAGSCLSLHPGEGKGKSTLHVLVGLV